MPFAKVLIANDEPDLLEVCRLTLEEAGHSVETVSNGQNLVDLARRFQPDVILLDWVMPHNDGRTVLAKLRQHPQTASIPVTMMSASREGEEVAARAGADVFLQKPFNAEERLHSVEAAFGPRGGGSRPGRRLASNAPRED